MKKNLFKSLMMTAMAVVCLNSLVSCGGDDGSSAGGGNNGDGGDGQFTNMMIINGTNYGPMQYCYILRYNDGNASLVFANVDIFSSSTTANTKITQLAVRFPYSEGLVNNYPNVDVDFDVNRVPATQACDLTGWSLDGSMNIAKEGDDYIVSVNIPDLHILNSDDERGSGQKGNLVLHYKGKIETGIGVGTVTPSLTYHDPMFLWGNTKEEVKSRLDASGYNFIIDNDSELKYSNQEGDVRFNYFFRDGKLRCISVYYMTYSEENYQWLVNEVETRYNIKMQEEITNGRHYCSDAYTNGMKTAISTVGLKDFNQMYVEFIVSNSTN